MEKVFLFFGLLFVSFLSSAQQSDSSQIADTIIIIEDPVIIEKVVYIESPSKKLKLHKPLYSIFQTAISYNFDYYSYCDIPLCKSYYDQIRSSTKPNINYSITAGVGFMARQKWIHEWSICYSTYRDLFVYQNTIGKEEKFINKYHYLEIFLQPGYILTFNRKKHFYLFKGGVGVAYLINSSGMIYSKYNSKEVSEIENELKLNKFIYKTELSASVGIKKSERLKYLFTLYYSYDLLSMINRNDFFTRQRNIFGVKMGVIIGKNRFIYF